MQTSKVLQLNRDLLKDLEAAKEFALEIQALMKTPNAELLAIDQAIPHVRARITFLEKRCQDQPTTQPKQ